jgi:hypothetical protein
MRWPQRHPTRSDIAGVLLFLGLLCFVAFRFIWLPQPNPATGFGPDWDCTFIDTRSGAEPICVKKTRSPALTSQDSRQIDDAVQAIPDAGLR